VAVIKTKFHYSKLGSAAVLAPMPSFGFACGFAPNDVGYHSGDVNSGLSIMFQDRVGSTMQFKAAVETRFAAPG
jgi:hypothetical protein